MQVPGSLTVRSDDGAIDLKRDVVIGTACGNVLSTGLFGVARDVGGNLAAELGDNVAAELDFNADWRGRLQIRIYFIRMLEDAPRPITVEAEMLTGERPCPQYVARKGVLVGAE
jgi:hypothetical protein